MRERYEACPLCGGQAHSFLRQGDCRGHPLYHPNLPPVVRWVTCDDCGHVFTEGYWTTEAWTLLGKRSNPAHEIGRDLEGHRHISARIVEKVAHFKTPTRGDISWLDVGVGNGSLLFTAAEWGYRPFGADIRMDKVEGLRARRVQAFHRFLEDLTPAGLGEVGVISLADSLEHMAFPMRALEAARRLLVTTGVLFVSMPNMDTELWRQLDRENANPFWNEVEHHHNFTRARLYDLFARTRFMPVHYDVSQRYRCCMEVIAHAV